MNRSPRSGEGTKSRFSGLGTFLLLLLFTGACTQAFAQCGMPKNLTAMKAQSNANSWSSMAATQSELPILTQEKSDDDRDSIVGLWRITARDQAGNIVNRAISGWTSDGLEFDQDLSPILTGNVCYGAWIKLGHNTYGLTHPFFNFQDVNGNGEGSESTEGQWDGNSGYFDQKVIVDKGGKTFTGKMILKIVEGPDPYDPDAKVLFTANFNLAATKVEVDKRLLP